MRRKIAVVMLIGMIVLSGCLSTTFSAPQATINESIASENEYKITDQQEISLNRKINISGYVQEFAINSNYTLYQKNISNEYITNISNSPVLFATLNTPSIKYNGESYSPIANTQQTEPIKSLMTAQFNDSVKINEKINTINKTHNNKNYTISEYNATYTIPNADINLKGKMLITIIKLDDSTVIIAGGYPNTYSEQRETMITFIENIKSN